MTSPESRSLDVVVLEDSLAVGNAVAEQILDDLEAHQNGALYVLGCPGGRSFRPTYQRLAQLAAEREVDWSKVVILMMDEYLDPDAAASQLASSSAHYSCHRFGLEEIWRPINAHLQFGARIPLNNLWIPDPTDPPGYDLRISDAGGVDLFLVASGASDGHVAFNPPGTPLDSQTRIVALADSTRGDNLATFPSFKSLEEVPRFGVTVGLGTIARLSRRVIMAITGVHKRESARKVLHEPRFNPEWPATFIHDCTNPALYLDHAASI